MIRCLTLGLVLSLAVVAAKPLPAGAAVCLERDAISSKLASDHGEHPSAAGLASNGELLEVFASEDGTWTLVLTDPTGVSCVVASGEGWSAEGSITDTSDS
ncbi:MAG: hypothetical protein RIC16_11445 [Rhodospirillales bacterium]